jgi:prepilin peptidase CpaA
MSYLWTHIAVDPLPWAVAILAAMVAAGIDVTTGRIPNLLTVPLLVGGIVWSVGAGSVGGALAGGGAGDAKLMAALGAWLGLANSIVVLVVVLVAGGVLAVALSVARRRVSEVLRGVRTIFLSGLVRILCGCGLPDQTSEASENTQARNMPYGVAIFAGVSLAAVGVWLWHA